MPNWFANEASQANVSPSSWTYSSRLPLRTAFASCPRLLGEPGNRRSDAARAVPFTVGAFHEQLQLVEVSHASSRVARVVPFIAGGVVGDANAAMNGIGRRGGDGDRSRDIVAGVCDDGHELVHVGGSRRYRGRSQTYPKGLTCPVCEGALMDGGIAAGA